MLQTQLNKFSRSFVEVAFYDHANKILNIFKAQRPSVTEFLMILLTKLLACVWSKQQRNAGFKRENKSAIFCRIS
jgi:hypothetical protein